MYESQYINQLDKFVNLVKPGLFVFAIFLILSEALILSVFKKAGISHKSGALSLISGGFVFGFEAIADILFYTSVAYWLYNHRIFELGFKWYIWVFCFLLYDLMFYISHRIQHEVRLLWCFHSTHHSTTEMRLSSAVRGSMFDFVYTPPFFIWMCVIGIHPLMFIAVRSISRVWGILEHIHESFTGHYPALDKLFITPDIHRVHHGKNYKYLDRNYAEIFSVWDRLFGTYQPYSEQPDYGILRPVNANSFIDTQFGGLIELYNDIKTTPGIKNKVKLCFMPPGWYPNGRNHTAKTLRRSVEIK